MKEVLFVCQGNVGRSQMAEGFYNYLKGGKVAISAGVVDVAAKYNGHPREDIVEAMHEKGIDISAHTIKQVTEEMLNEIQAIVILCNESECPPFLISSGINTFFRHVEDPFEFNMNEVRQVRDQIEKIVIELIKQELSFD